jgi:alpha-tubulin suppressor-like RCC1 family protein
MALEPTTNFKDSNNVDLGRKLVTKDYLISVYPGIGDKIGIPPELWTWGYGSIGQLGNASANDSSTPVTTFAGGTNWKQISVNREHSAAIKTDGTLWTWGFASNAKLGNGVTTFTTISTPITTFAGGTNWKQVSTGDFYTAAIKTDGTLWTWGQNNFGQLGVNNTISRSTPVTTFAGGTNWKQVSCGGYHVAAIKTDGTLWTWGQVDLGKLGTNDTSPNRSTPVTTFAGGNNWKQVDAGGEHTSAIKTDGTLWMWGYIPDISSGYITTIPTPVTTFAGGTNWKQVSCGELYIAAIKTDGTLWSWGYGEYGQLGNNNTTSRLTPVTTFAGGTNWKQVSAGNAHTAAIKTDGTLWTWGINDFLQLGTGDNNSTDKSTPVTTFAGGTNWKQVSGGARLTGAIKSVDF